MSAGAELLFLQSCPVVKNRAKVLAHSKIQQQFLRGNSCDLTENFVPFCREHFALQGCAISSSSYFLFEAEIARAI